MAALNTTVRVTLSPSPGFCIKSTTLHPAVCKVTGESVKSSDTVSTAIRLPNTLSIAQGQKAFVNIAWDPNVPPPPEASEEEIQKAIAGDQDTDQLVEGGSWFVPVVVSEPRNDVDKAGKPSVVFDCIYNTSLKSRALRDGNFRAFLAELGLQRIEAQHSVALSRQLGTPNILSKGKLFSRTALVPLRLYPAAHPVREESEKRRKSLIEEVEPGQKADADGSSKVKSQDSRPPPKSILKNASLKSNVDEISPQAAQRPKFEWTKEGDELQIMVHAPNVTHDDITKATLDIEPRRVILSIPGPPPYTLDIDLSLPDAALAATFGGTSVKTSESVLMLKRQRDFDVDGARAEWRVQEGTLVLFA